MKYLRSGGADVEVLVCRAAYQLINQLRCSSGILNYNSEDSLQYSTQVMCTSEGVPSPVSGTLSRSRRRT